VQLSLDLGLSFITAGLSEEGVSLPDGTILAWNAIKQIDEERGCCFRIVDGSPVPLRGFSEMLGRSHALVPTPGAPALVIAGFPMHRIKDIDPRQAAILMVQAVAPFRGEVLDTATGLGYAAIEMAKSAAQVITIELDPVSQEMAHLNPWSKELFGNPTITQVIGDSAECIAEFASGRFACIVHDPPTLTLAGDLYSGAFYQQAFRVLKKGGRMFHYIGDPHSRSGARTTKGVIKRLYEAGFSRVTPDPKAHGVVAIR
jgi:hypothetical protein